MTLSRNDSNEEDSCRTSPVNGTMKTAGWRRLSLSTSLRSVRITRRTPSPTPRGPAQRSILPSASRSRTWRISGSRRRRGSWFRCRAILLLSVRATLSGTRQPGHVDLAHSGHVVAAGQVSALVVGQRCGVRRPDAVSDLMRDGKNCAGASARLRGSARRLASDRYVPVDLELLSTGLADP